MNKIIISAIAASLLTISSAQAFDDQREGFLVGLGAGLSLVNSEVATYDETSLGFATSFKIGYGFSNQFLLYYVNNVSFFGQDYSNDTFTTGGSSIGASYYFDENSPYYALGSIGLGSFGNFSSGNGEIGSTFSIGAGYEYSPHILLEGVFEHVNVDDYSYNGASTNSLRFTINYMWY